MKKKQIRITYSSTNEKNIEDVIINLIKIHDGKGNVKIKNIKKVANR